MDEHLWFEVWMIGHQQIQRSSSIAVPGMGNMIEQGHGKRNRDHVWACSFKRATIFVLRSVPPAPCFQLPSDCQDALSQDDRAQLIFRQRLE